MAWHYYINQVDMLMDDTTYDARMTYFFVTAVFAAAAEDKTISDDELLIIRRHVNATCKQICKYNPQMSVTIRRMQS